MCLSQNILDEKFPPQRATDNSVHLDGQVREQAKAYLSLQGEALAGLNLVNTTNLEYLPQKNMLNTAEIFRLKGLLLAKLNNPDNANQAFSSALQLCKGALPACWISWGAHCEERYQVTSEEHP